jgi:hypothetical protein
VVEGIILAMLGFEITGCCWPLPHRKLTLLVTAPVGLS